MTTEAEWQAALADLDAKKIALREAEAAFALADKLVAQLYLERNNKCTECSESTQGRAGRLCPECRALAQKNMIDWMRREGP